MALNFQIIPGGDISNRFLNLALHDFTAASAFVKNLPYRRNSDKNDLLCVLKDAGGTCSTKHAILKRLAEENSMRDLKLMLGIFMMNGQNTPKIVTVLDKHQLNQMPEAHNYIRENDEILDFTSRNSTPEDFISYVVKEIEIEPDQITDFKINYHQNFLHQYLKENSGIPYSPPELWRIREECIAALQH